MTHLLMIGEEPVSPEDQTLLVSVSDFAHVFKFEVTFLQPNLVFHLCLRDRF